MRKARGRDSLQALSKLTRVVDGHRMINDDPPLLVRIPEGDEIRGQIHAILESYKRTLQEDRRHLLDRYRFVDVARKVVGVGSVGIWLGPCPPRRYGGLTAGGPLTKTC